jgi:predicted  nucleic acid-binding Zn-ribbon protein
LIQTATDDEFFEAVIRQVKGNAEETLAERRQQRAEAAANHASIRKQLNVLANNLTRLGVNAEDLSQVKSKMDSLKEQDQQLDRRIRELDRDIHALQYQQVDKKQLREAFRDFAALHSDAQPETKRRLLNVITEEIRRSVKRGGNSQVCCS